MFRINNSQVHSGNHQSIQLGYLRIVVAMLLLIVSLGVINAQDEEAIAALEDLSTTITSAQTQLAEIQEQISTLPIPIPEEATEVIGQGLDAASELLSVAEVRIMELPPEFLAVLEDTSEQLARAQEYVAASEDILAAQPINLPIFLTSEHLDLAQFELVQIQEYIAAQPINLPFCNQCD